MRLAPGIRHDEAALRAPLETFLETIAVVRRNDQCPGFVRSCRHFEGECSQNSAEEEEHQAKQLAVVARGAPYFLAIGRIKSDMKISRIGENRENIYNESA
jgi:hypothetical protein